MHDNQQTGAQKYFEGLIGNMETGGQYLGTYLGNKTAKESWIQAEVVQWRNGIGCLSKAARSYPQSAYHGLQKSLQAEWKFLQRTTPDIEHLLQGLQDDILNKFIPSLFGEDTFTDDDYRHLFINLPIKHAGMAISNPASQAQKNWNDSVVLNTHLISALRGKEEFNFT